MKFSDYLFYDDDNEESLDLTTKLLLMDKALKQLHTSGRYISSRILDAVIVNNQIDPSSINIDVFDQDKNENDYYQDIIELCAIGICAYNHFGESVGYPAYYTSAEFIQGLENDIEPFLAREDIPDEIKDYYRTVFTLIKPTYMTDYLMEHQKDGDKGTARQLIYSTPEGKALASEDNEKAAYSMIVVIPFILATAYVFALIILFIAKNA